MDEEISYKTRNGEWKTETLRDSQRITSLICPVDGTSLVETNDENLSYISCINCGRPYHASENLRDCTQEEVNNVYWDEIEKTKGSLNTLRENYRLNHSRLTSKLKELENPFTQDE